MFKKTIILIIMAIFLSSCVVTEEQFKKTQNDIYYLQTTTARINQRISNLEKRTTQLEKNFEKLEKNHTSLKATQLLKFNELAAELQSIKNQMNDMSKLPKISSSPNASTEVTQEAIKDIYSRLNDIEAQISMLKSKKSSSQLSEPTTVKNDKYYYKEAYKLFAAGKYRDAEKKFSAFIVNFKNSSLLPNAYYWLGESYFKLKMYDKAIINYDNVIVKFPKHSKVPAALLKEGIAFLRIGEKDGAKLIFKRIIQDYPKTIQAKYARNYLKRLK